MDALLYIYLGGGGGGLSVMLSLLCNGVCHFRLFMFFCLFFCYFCFVLGHDKGRTFFQRPPPYIPLCTSNYDTIYCYDRFTRCVPEGMVCGNVGINSRVEGVERDVGICFG